ncbi:hypothetical protein JST97_09535 [bacterium]|nr:hypothetical protein [bacterium]
MEIGSGPLPLTSQATLQAYAQAAPAAAGPAEVVDSVELSAAPSARPVKRSGEMGDWKDTLRAVDRFRGAVLVLGFGNKGQYKDPAGAKLALDQLADQFDAQYGKGRWLAVFGGDAYKQDAPDVAHLVRHLQEQRAVPALAIQSDKVKEWGGVDKQIDLVHYVPTTLGADGKIVWGGFVEGKPVGPTAAYLGEDFIGGQSPRLKAVVAVGGGEIAGQEAVYARQHGIPVHYVRAEARYEVPGGRFGAIDSMLV